RDFHVTGVQTCALPIWVRYPARQRFAPRRPSGPPTAGGRAEPVAGRARAPLLLCAGVSVVRRNEDRVRIPRRPDQRKSADSDPRSEEHTSELQSRENLV